jgi:hypothetical protein
MFNVCYQCGQYRADKQIDPKGPSAICPECGFQHNFLYLPLLIVSGASGTGKSTICQLLTGTIIEAVLLDSDLLWAPHFDQPEDDYRTYFETWLRLCKNINQSGRPVVLFGAGMGVPKNLETCIERRYFPSIHYLALTCSAQILTRRLHARPSWRGSSEPEFLQEHLKFNQWFIDYNQDNQQPPITMVDTSHITRQDSAQEVAAWIHHHIQGLSR